MPPFCPQEILWNDTKTSTVQVDHTINALCTFHKAFWLSPIQLSVCVVLPDPFSKNTKIRLGAILSFLLILIQDLNALLNLRYPFHKLL